MLAPDSTIVICVAPNHAVVSRYRPLPDGSLSCERAANAEELEPAALDAIASQDQPILLGVHYLCPPHVAAQAVWPELALTD